MPLGFPPAALEAALAYTPCSGDIFVASYPKSGTTWLQYIVYLLLRRRVLGPHEQLTDVFPHLEEVGAAPLGELPSPRLIKTHLSFERAPWSAEAKYLVIARNPFDCAVSFYHHTRGFPQHYDFADGTFPEYCACFIAGEVDFGGYFDHLLSWHAAAARPNVMFLTYEALRQDPSASIRAVAAFLGAGPGAFAASDSGLSWILGHADIASMRRDQQRWSSPRPGWARPFVRRGIVGDWRSLFSPAMTRALLAEFDRRLSGSGCEALWPDVLADARRFAG